MSAGYEPTLHRALLGPDAAVWHPGGGSVSYSFPTRIPDHYIRDGAYEVGGTRFRASVDPALTAPQKAAVVKVLARFDEVANVGFVPAPAASPPALPGGVVATGRLVAGLGGAAGYGETTLPRSDDGYFQIDLSALFPDGLNVFGTRYRELFVNTNGSVSFGNGILAYAPAGLAASHSPLLAPFWADMDTRAGALAGAESGEIHVDLDPVRRAVTVTWDRVNAYDRDGSFQNSVQLQILDRGSGNFDVVFRYDNIDWTGGPASGGAAPAAGIGAGPGGPVLTLPGSGDAAAMRALDVTAGNTGITGLWLFQSRGGTVAPWAGGGAQAVPTGDITFGQLALGPGTEGLALPPGPGAGGDVWLDAGLPANAQPGAGPGWGTLMRLVGRALGLGQGEAGRVLPPDFDTPFWTVTASRPLPAEAHLPAAERTQPATPMLLDLQALQIAYGPNLATRTGDDTYFGPGSVPGFQIPRGGRLLATIWDAGGIDTFSAANQLLDAVIDLRPGQPSTIGALQGGITIALGVPGTRARSAVIENAVGGLGNDRLTGNSVANTLTGGAGSDLLAGLGGDDRLFGGSGADSLHGNEGADSLFGGSGNDRLAGDLGDDVLAGGPGADVFVMRQGGGFDRVSDYADGQDRIDVSLLRIGAEALRFVDVAPGRVRVFAGAESLLLVDPTGELDRGMLGPEDFTGLL